MCHRTATALATAAAPSHISVSHASPHLALLYCHRAVVVLPARHFCTAALWHYTGDPQEAGEVVASLVGAMADDGGDTQVW